MKRITNLLTTLVLFFGMVSSALAVTVCKEGPPKCDHTSIKAALLDQDHRGETVIVGPGSYFESGLVLGGTSQGGPRTLISENPTSPEATIIDGTGSNQPVIQGITADTIQGFTIRGGNGGIRGVGNGTVLQDLNIEDNVSDQPGGGVRAGDSAPSVTIINCKIRRNRAPGGGAGIWANVRSR